MAFTNSYNDSSYTKGQQAASQGASVPPPPPQQPMQAAQQSAPAAPEGAPPAAPGFDLVDGVASILFAPGRAIVGQFHQPTMRDLPLIIGLSAAFYYGCWWAYQKWFAEAEYTPKVRVKRAKAVRVVDDEDEE